jgi:hypothetical protein
MMMAHVDPEKMVRHARRAHRLGNCMNVRFAASLLPISRTIREQTGETADGNRCYRQTMSRFDRQVNRRQGFARSVS